MVEKQSLNPQVIQLSSDQFEVNEKGELVIKNEELADLVRNLPAKPDTPEAPGVNTYVYID